MPMERGTPKIVPIMGGIVGAFAGFALLFWAISYFVPRFLRASSDGRTRLLFICAMSVIVLLNVFQRYRRRRARQEQSHSGKKRVRG